MSLVLTVTLQVFKIRKRVRKIIKVDSKNKSLSSDSLKNVYFSENYKQCNNSVRKWLKIQSI